VLAVATESYAEVALPQAPGTTATHKDEAAGKAVATKGGA